MTTAEPRLGVIFKSYEPLRDIQAYARATEEAGLSGGFWIAEAYHWFRNYGHEARGAMTTLAAAALATKSIPIGLGIGSPYIRHPTVQAAEACALDELSNGRFIMGMGTGKVGVVYLEMDLKKATPVKVHRESIAIFKGVVSGEKFSFQGDIFRCEVPAISPERRHHRAQIPVYVGATGPLMQRMTGEVADGLLLPGLTSSGFVRWARDNLAKGFARANRVQPAHFPVGGVILCSVSKDGRKAREAARPYAATYVVNKIRNIQNDDILTKSGVSEDDLEPLRARVASGNENLVDITSDKIMRCFNVVAGTPSECVEILQDLVDAGLNLPLMEVVGADATANLETIRLLGSSVVSHLKPQRLAA